MVDTLIEGVTPLAVAAAELSGRWIRGGFPEAFSAPAIVSVSTGGKISSGPTSSATFPCSDHAFRPRRSAASGPCSRITSQA